LCGVTTDEIKNLCFMMQNRGMVESPPPMLLAKLTLMDAML